MIVQAREAEVGGLLWGQASQGQLGKQINQTK